MSLDRFLAELDGHLFPQPYTRRIAAEAETFPLLLTAKVGVMGRYALAVTPWETGLSGAAFLASRRRAAARTLGALWMFREVGLYLVVHGAQKAWQAEIAEAQADKTGLHAVILQAVHFIDLDGGRVHLNQSAWGPVSFGGVDAVAPAVESAAIAAKH